MMFYNRLTVNVYTNKTEKSTRSRNDVWLSPSQRLSIFFSLFFYIKGAQIIQFRQYIPRKLHSASKWHCFFGVFKLLSLRKACEENVQF